jgi:hypothetical protein
MGAARTRLAAFATGTGALTSWAPSADAEVKALSLTADASKVIIGGDFTHVNGSSQSHISALDPAAPGAPLPWATHLSYSVIDLDVDANGVYVAGGGGGGNFAALNPATGGMLWNGGTDGNVQAVAVVGGVVYLGGHYGSYCGPGSGAPTPVRIRRCARSCSPSTRPAAPSCPGTRARTARWGSSRSRATPPRATSSPAVTTPPSAAGRSSGSPRFTP